MGRPPCCDKVGIKKGPWTPEEDIILVSYIQEHGPGNWRSVPTITGLLRCSKSCRLRWTNYLRPGIKRGNFTPHEEGMIIHLQALLGNKWAAIASYLPQRTDNDIKNYWNTHLKKKLKKLQSEDHTSSTSTTQFFASNSSLVERRSFDYHQHLTSNHGSSSSPSPPLWLNQTSSSIYASSTENISRLLEGWMRSSPNNKDKDHQNNHDIATSSQAMTSNLHCYRPKAEQECGDDHHMISSNDFESILSFGSLNANNSGWEKSSCDCETKGCLDDDFVKDEIVMDHDKKQSLSINTSSTTPPPPPLSFLEKWLLDESGVQVEDMMDLSPMF